MKKVVKKIITYTCSVCQEEHENRTEARECKMLPLEKAKFRVGDLVRTVFKPKGWCCRKSTHGFVQQGRVTQVIGPRVGHPVRADKTLKRITLLYGWRHVFQFELTYHCPYCDEKKTAVFWTSDLRKV